MRSLLLDYFQARTLDAEEAASLNWTVKEYEQALELIENRFAGGSLPIWKFSRLERNLRTLARRPSTSE